MQVTLTPRQLLAVAVVSEADVRTITRRLAGLAVRPTSAERIDAALAQLGLAPAAALHDRAPEAR